MKYVDASALLRLLFSEPGPSVSLTGDEFVVSSRIVEIEAYRAVDRLRLLGDLDDIETAVKRKELSDLLAMLDLASIDDAVIERARSSFAVNLRALDAIHAATAEVLALAGDGEPLEFWTHDDRQAAAALSRGLTVYGVGGGES
jgi:predicted nucleic acid-binding protein